MAKQKETIEDNKTKVKEIKSKTPKKESKTPEKDITKKKNTKRTGKKVNNKAVISEKGTEEKTNNLFFFSQWVLLTTLVIAALVIIAIPQGHYHINKTDIMVTLIFLILLVIYSLFNYKKSTKRNKDSISVGSYIFSIIVLTMILSMLTLQSSSISTIKKGFWEQFNLIKVLQQKTVNLQKSNVVLQKNIINLQSQNQLKIQALEKEKLNYGNLVKNKTIDMIIHSLQNIKSHNISNIDISNNPSTLTKKQILQKIREARIKNGSIDLEN